MKAQTFKTHKRLVIGFHVVTSLLIIALIGGSIVNLIHADKHTVYSSSLICLIAVILTLIFVFVRQFPLKAQDRAIRAEENLRHFVLSGKPLDNRLSINQIIALRFASDEEFVELAKKALEQNLDSNSIKKLVTNWRGDFHRV
jgi:hypothetical protein